MASIGIFYGSDTGHTEEAAKFMQELLGSENADLFDVRKVKDPQIIKNYKLVIMGTPTWYLGELQEDMDNFMGNLTDVDVQGQTIALFGLGDQVQYSDYFVDGMGKLYHFLSEKGANIVGNWPCDGYSFSSALSLTDDNMNFVGLALDEDNQSDLSTDRIVTWIEQVKAEANIDI